MDSYLHAGEQVIYKGERIKWQVRTVGELQGPPLTAEEAEAINTTSDLSLTYPEHRHGAKPPATATLGPDRLRVRKPVAKGNETIIFMYTGDVHAPLKT